jgi:hypothetical protein
MATSSVVKFNGIDTQVFDVIASATADNAIQIAHKLGVLLDGAFGNIFFTPLLAAAWISQWRVQQTLTTVNTLSLVKTSVASSAANTAQLRVTIQRPHSTGR